MDQIQENIANLRKDRDAARREAATFQETLGKVQAELESIKTKVIPDDLEIPDGTTDPIAFIRTTVATAKEMPTLTSKMEELQTRLEMHDITSSSLWATQVTQKQSQALADIHAALGDYRLEADPAKPGATRPVLKNQDFVQKAMDALKSAPDHSLPSVKAALATVTDSAQPDPGTVRAVSEALSRLVDADAAANNLKTNWSTAKEQADAQRILQAQAAAEAQKAEIVQNFNALATQFDIPEFTDMMPAARTAASTRFSEGIKAPSVAAAVEVQVKAALFDAAIADAIKWRKHEVAMGLQRDADKTAGPAPAQPLPARTTVAVAHWLV